MAADKLRAYAESQIKKIAEKAEKLDPKKTGSATQRARLASASMKWMRRMHNAA